MSNSGISRGPAPQIPEDGSRANPMTTPSVEQESPPTPGGEDQESIDLEPALEDDSESD